MIGYVTLGTNDIAKATKFYDALLAELGASRVIEGERFVAWSTAQDHPAVSVIKPFDGKDATIGNGTMVALAANSTETVDRIYAKAMKLGARDEGAPGLRMDGFYAAYFRDPDGNKLNIFTMTGQ